MPRRSPRLEEMAATQPANQEPTQPVAPTMPQPTEPSFTRDATGAYKYVGQVLLNRPPATQRSFYAVLEENGFEDDILSLWTVDNLETFKYKTQKLMKRNSLEIQT